MGIKGQTKEMIKRDIDILKEHFKYGCINIYIENTTPVKGDQVLIQSFKENYSYLEEYDNIEILWNNTDFGVGGNEDENKTYKLVKAGIVAALYVILTYALPTLAYGPIQFRISEILTLLAYMDPFYIGPLTLDVP